MVLSREEQWHIDENMVWRIVRGEAGEVGVVWATQCTTYFRALPDTGHIGFTMTMRAECTGRDKYVYEAEAVHAYYGTYNTRGMAPDMGTVEQCLRTYYELSVEWIPKLFGHEPVLKANNKSTQEVVKVVELHPPERDEAIVRQLRKMLEEAERGELVGLAFVGAYRGQGTYSRGLYGAVLYQQTLLGLELLRYQVVKEAYEGGARG